MSVIHSLYYGGECHKRLVRVNVTGIFCICLEPEQKQKKQGKRQRKRMMYVIVII